jgi:cis-3-alkyl-4-acyloxetan-2-one decarboxylase
MIPGLAKLGRIVVPDHMGFGKSETPQDREYSVEEHCDNLAALLLSLDLRDVTLVMQDWGGPIGSNFAFRYPERIRRVVYVDSLARVGLPESVDLAELAKAGNPPWAEFISSEDYEPVMTHLSKTILSVLKLIGFDNNDVVTDEWLRAYAAPFPTVASCKGALAFPRNTMNPEAWTFLEAALRADGVIEALRDKPALAIHGERDKNVPRFLAEPMLREIWPEAPFVLLPGVNHYAQEDAPDTLVAMISQFVQSS